MGPQPIKMTWTAPTAAATIDGYRIDGLREGQTWFAHVWSKPWPTMVQGTSYKDTGRKRGGDHPPQPIARYIPGLCG